MRRREFIAWIGSAAAAPALAPLPSLAQQPAMPVIGYLSSKGEAAEAGIVAAIRKGLGERGLVEGSNVKIVFRWSDGDYSRLPQLAADLVKRESQCDRRVGSARRFGGETGNRNDPHRVQAGDRPGRLPFGGELRPSRRQHHGRYDAVRSADAEKAAAAPRARSGGD